MSSKALLEGLLKGTPRHRLSNLEVMVNHMNSKFHSLPANRVGGMHTHDRRYKRVLNAKVLRKDFFFNPQANVVSSSSFFRAKVVIQRKLSDLPCCQQLDGFRGVKARTQPSGVGLSSSRKTFMGCTSKNVFSRCFYKIRTSVSVAIVLFLELVLVLESVFGTAKKL